MKQIVGKYYLQAGLTLIELMISLVLGLTLMIGAITMFQQNKQTYNFQESMARLQENGRFAMDLLAQDIRASGYWGCSTGVPDVTNTLTSGGVGTDFTQGVTGYEATPKAAPAVGDWSPNLDANVFAANALGGRDVIVVRTAAGCGGRVVDMPGCPPNTSADIKANAGAASCLSQYDVAMVSNCKEAAIFMITNLTTAGGQTNIVHNTGVSNNGLSNSTKDLGACFTAGDILGVNNLVYFIATGTGGVPSLFRIKNAGTAEELVEGVEDMQLLYGVDSDLNGSVDCFVSASVVDAGDAADACDTTPTATANTHWDKVIAVRLTMVLSTLRDNILGTAQTLYYDRDGSDTVTQTAVDKYPNKTSYPQDPATADRRIRKVFSRTIAIRNRIS